MTPAVARFVLRSPRDLVVGDRLLRAQIGAPESPLANALPVTVVGVEIVGDCVKATVAESGRDGVWTRRMVFRCDLGMMALVCVDESVEEG